MDDVVLVAALAAVACGLAGLLVPAVIARLPEPPPDPVLAELEAKALEGSLSDRQQLRLDEGPKTPYVDLAATPNLGPICSVVAAVAAVLVVIGIGIEPRLVMVLPVVPLGVLLAYVDLRTRLLPRALVFAGVAWGVATALALWPVEGDPDALLRGLVGMAVAFVFTFVLWFVYPPGWGYGDVRLSGLCGLLLAYQGWAEFAVGLYSSLVLFALPALVLVVVRRSIKLLKLNVPMGPFLLAGIVVGLLAAAPIADRLVAG